MILETKYILYEDVKNSIENIKERITTSHQQLSKEVKNEIFNRLLNNIDPEIFDLFDEILNGCDYITEEEIIKNWIDTEDAKNDERYELRD